MPKRLILIKGDITQMQVDAIVNAANSTLLGGGGVDGAIHRAAGSQLLNECRALNGCKTGEAKITKGYSLPAKHVIHTVGPIWNDGKNNEADLLQQCYTNSLQLAVQNNLVSIAFPSISTGAYKFPIQQASQIALAAIKDFLKQNTTLEKVAVVCFSDSDLKVYQDTWNKLIEN